jgi:hypothetical protein
MALPPQSLHSAFLLPCWQMPLPPQSLQRYFWRLCRQRMWPPRSLRTAAPPPARPPPLTLPPLPATAPPPLPPSTPTPPCCASLSTRSCFCPVFGSPACAHSSCSSGTVCTRSREFKTRTTQHCATAHIGRSGGRSKTDSPLNGRHGAISSVISSSLLALTHLPAQVDGLRRACCGGGTDEGKTYRGLVGSAGTRGA